ncbi:hypothetical protein DPMN_076511 [Dreissena polymorpha]|uniref:Myb-like domain-containing protein n=1 Tax=Dreissena polymorpha TaxID=45954 RepID=A0A9D4BQK7_DREPO|nr:hypothetical protein DPMN_076511 [Dreissena polymorpha]
MADNNANVATSRNRWSEQEETVIAQEIIKHYDVLFGPMTGCGALKIGEVRRRGWEAVANVLNCQFSTYKRSGSEVKKKYYNMKDKRLGAQKTSSVFQRAVEDEAGPCSSGTKTNTKSMKMANKNQSKRARASFNKLAEDNLIAEKKNIHLQQKKGLGKQRRLRWDATSCGVSSGSTLFS